MIGNGGTSPIRQDSLLLNRPFSATGLPPVGAPSASDILIKPNASIGSPVDYYVEALAGERLLVAMAIVNISAATDIGAGEYGNLTALTNGIQLFVKINGVLLDVSDGLPLKINEDWGRWNFDSRPVTIGPTNKTPVWQARWDLIKYGSPYGLILEEGGQLGVRIRDNLSGLTEQTIIAEGVHLGVPSPSWTILL